MDHHRAMTLAVLAHVGEIEALWQLEVELNGGHLPFPPDRIHELDVDFRAVEAGLARFPMVRQLHALQRFLQRALRLLPHLAATDVLGLLLGVTQ